VKKFISIGVAVALLAIAVMPVGVAAQCDVDDEYQGVIPDTYAKIPFAIIESGFVLLETLWPDLDAALGLDMLWVGPVFGEVGAWAGGPLGWTVDMLGWGLGIVQSIVVAIGPTLGLPDFVGDVLTEIVCMIFTPFDCVVGDPWDPCP
jgi:hypothetical protein